MSLRLIYALIFLVAAGATPDSSRCEALSFESLLAISQASEFIK